MNTTFNAEFDIVWLIVGVFWVIAQIAGAAAKKNKLQRPPPVPDEHSEPTADPLTELLRKLSGEIPFDEPQAEPKFEELVEEPEFMPQSPWTPGEIEALPDLSRSRESPVPILASAPSEISEIDIRPTMKTFRSASMAMKQPSMNLRMQGLEKPGGTVSGIEGLIDPSDRRSLRRAMLSHIIFSPPKAFEEIK